MKKSIFLWPFALLLTLIIISCGNDNSKNGSDTTKNDTTKNDVMKTGIQQADW